MMSASVQGTFFPAKPVPTTCLRSTTFAPDHRMPENNNGSRIRCFPQLPAAAEAIGVSYKTLRDAIAQNQVRTIEFGHVTRVPKAEIERLKEAFA